MIGARPFLAAVFLVALSLTPAGQGQSGEHSEVPDQMRAYALWQQGYLLHLHGQYRAAVDSFRESIEILPTAEGHTFLGWSLSMLGHLEQALAECKKAIALDPDFGNPYNDIGGVPDRPRSPGRGDPVAREGDLGQAILLLSVRAFQSRPCACNAGEFRCGEALLRKGIAARSRLSGRADGPGVSGQAGRNTALAFVPPRLCLTLHPDRTPAPDRATAPARQAESAPTPEAGQEFGVGRVDTKHAGRLLMRRAEKPACDAALGIAKRSCPRPRFHIPDVPDERRGRLYRSGWRDSSVVRHP